jgi:alkylation response protein AidB-like acyl-CoA dehydrogenase
MFDTTLHDAVAAAISLAPHIRAVREELETTRRVPLSLVQAINDAGLFRPYLPHALGGLELPPLTVFRMIEEISKVDGSVGWCTMIASSVSLLSGWLRTDIARALFGQPPDVRLAGSLRPEGQASLVDGGYRIRGRWDFASGIHHANWLLCTCTVMDGDAPRQTPTGVPETRSMLVPVDKATLVDTWSVVGMCGTGSHDFIVDDVFVPALHSLSLLEPPQAPGPLYHPRLPFVVLWTGTVANALGMARGAMGTFIELATQAGSTSSPTLLRDRALVQTQVAEAEAILSAARAYVLASVGAAWEAVCAGVPDPSHEIAQARLAITHGMHEAVRVVDRLFHAAGTNGIYRKYGLERYFRDVHTAVQHAAGLPVHIESAGKVFLGLRPQDLGW